MATQLQIRRGTAAQVAAFTGAEGEIVYNSTNDSLHTNDGSTAGGFELARADGANFALTSAISTTANFSFGDNDKAIFGAGSDLQIYHDGSNSYISEGGTGNLFIDGTNLYIRKGGGLENYIDCLVNGEVNLYHDGLSRLSTTATGIDVLGTATISTDLNVGGAVKGNAGTRAVSIGAAGSVIGGLQLWSTTAGTSYVQFGDESGTSANHYRGYMSYNHSTDTLGLGASGSTKVSVNSTGIDVTGEITADGIALGDSQKATFGASDDLQIYHTGSDSIIQDTGTGNLKIQGSDIRINNADSSKSYISATDGGSLLAYHNGYEKLATTSTGIDVTGTVTATGTSVFASLDISGDIDVDGTTNLDVVDIDGAVDMASTLTVAGTLSSAGGLVHQGDANTSLDFGTDQQTFYVGAVRALDLSTTGAVFNEGSVDADFRVESNGNANMLFVDGGNNRVGIGTAAPQQIMHLVNGGLQVSGQIASPASGQSAAYFDYSNGGARVWSRGADASTRGTINFYQLENDGGNQITSLSFNASGAATFNSSVVATNFNFSAAPNYAGLSLGVYNSGTWLNTPANTTGFLGVGGQGMLSWHTGGVNLAGAVIINEAGADADFRVESDNLSHALFVQGSDGYIGLNTSAPTQPLSVGARTGANLNYINGTANSVSTASGILISDTITSENDVGFGLLLANNANNDNARSPVIGFSALSASSSYQHLYAAINARKIGNGADTNWNMGQLEFSTGSGTGPHIRVVIDKLGGLITTPNADGHTVFNENGSDADFRVESNNNSHMLFVDGGNNTVTVGSSISNAGAPFLVDYNNTSKFMMGGVQGGISNNIYYNGSAWASINNSAGGGILQIGTDGSFNFRRGTASANPTLSYSMILDGNGAATFNSTVTLPQLAITSASTADTVTLTRGTNGQNNIFKFATGSTDDWIVGERNDSSSDLHFYSYGTSGNVLSIARATGGLTTNPAAGGHAVFNEGGVDADFRVESDGNANAFVVDASANFVSVGQVTYAGPGNGNNNVGWASTTDGRMWASAASDHGFNRTGDGVVLSLRSAGAEEGTISISGSTCAFNGFSGRHESSGIPANTLVGTVVSTIDELDVYDSSSSKSGQTRADHAKIKVSDSVGDSCVYGVLAEFTESGKAAIASVGIGSVFVTGACSKGDLLESNGDGTAKVQADDIIRSKTIGKVTIGDSNTGVKLVASVLYCG